MLRIPLFHRLTPLLLLPLAACSLDFDAEGEEGNLGFSLLGPTCFLGCSVADGIALAGAVVEVQVTDREGAFGMLSVRSADEARGKVLAQKVSTVCSDSGDQPEVGGTCPDGSRAQTYVTVELETTAEDAQLIVDDSGGKLVDRATVRVGRAARIEVTVSKPLQQPSTTFAVGDILDFQERLFDADEVPLQHQRRTVTRTVAPPELLVPRANSPWSDDPEWDVKAAGTARVTSTALGGATTTTTLTLR